MAICLCFWCLVKCRKVGAANWGNKSKKNENLERKSPELEFYEKYAANYRRKGEPAPLDLSKHVPQQDGPQGPYMLPRFARTGNFIRRAEEELGKPYEKIKDAILAGLGYSKMNEEFEKHDMFDPKTGKKHVANVEQDHKDMAKKGFVHVDPKKIEKILRDEGGAAGMDPFLKEFGKEMEDEIIKALEGMPNVGQHKDGDYILSDKKTIKIVKEIKNCGCGMNPCKTYGR